MFSVFASSIFTTNAMLKQISFTQAFGILIDVFFIRITLVPTFQNIKKQGVLIKLSARPVFI
ncbi:hypothetical protein P40081_26915 [Paenibacillus sp. FSL P4-0081]|nr:hypothetical protein P40081_26915 [Paenibacillus sp. FSL P4-0081]OMF28212.1 hypothetical protein BK132_14145 [Paenibacillus sp. FSL H8-0259]